MSGLWPSPAQEAVLRACLAPQAEALHARDALTAHPQQAELDPATLQLAPLFYRRWPDSGHPLAVTGKRAYLSIWAQNRERLEHLAVVLDRFRTAGIRCLVLKGAALLLRHYRDLGVRPMRDFDLLVAPEAVEAAARQLAAAGYASDDGWTIDAILRHARVGHAWQFSLGREQSCDLHWRPVVRCYSPEVARLFWEGAAEMASEYGPITALSPTDQLFHVCAHGLQWDWVPQVRWIADAVTVMREPVDWARIGRLADEAPMRMRLARALDCLGRRFGAPVPPGFPAHLESSAPPWERCEYGLMLKPCPLGPADSVRWHLHHFRRIRAFDPEWSGEPFWLGFPQYIAAFLNARGGRDLWHKLRPEFAARFRRRG